MSTEAAFTDITIKCTNGVLYYCRFLLMRIQYYNTMFTSGFGDSMKPEINFKGTIETFASLCQFIEREKLPERLAQTTIEELYSFALFTNYEQLLSEIILLTNGELFTWSNKIIKKCAKHNHEAMIRRYGLFIKTVGSEHHYKSRNVYEDYYKIFAEYAPQYLNIYNSFSLNAMTVGIINTAWEIKDDDMLKKIDKIIKSVICGNAPNNILTGMNINIILSRKEVFKYLELWVLNNKNCTHDEKNKIKQFLLCTEFDKGVKQTKQQASVLKILRAVADDHEFLKLILLK